MPEYLPIADKATLDAVKNQADLIGSPNPETGGTDELFKYLKQLELTLANIELTLANTCVPSSTPRITLISTETLISSTTPTAYKVFIPYTGMVWIYIESRRMAFNPAIFYAGADFGAHGVPDSGLVVIDPYEYKILTSNDSYTVQYFSIRVVAGSVIRMQLSGGEDRVSYVRNLSIRYDIGRSYGFQV